MRDAPEFYSAPAAAAATNANLTAMPPEPATPLHPVPACREPAESVERAPDPRAEQMRARQRTSVFFAITLLLLCAIALVALPIPKIPFFVRALIAAGDLIVAAVLWLVVRQKLDQK
jgi:hypothetical protein